MAGEAGNRQSAQVDDVMSRVPADILASLNDDQVGRLRAVIAEARPWREHPINIRLSLSLFARRLFITLIGGIDRRGPTRRSQDRSMHPIATGPNAIFLGVVVVVLYAIAGLVALLVAAAVRGG